MSNVKYLDLSGAADRLHRRSAAQSLLIANARLADAREAERNALAYALVAIAALLLSIGLVAWAIFA